MQQLALPPSSLVPPAPCIPRQISGGDKTNTQAKYEMFIDVAYQF